MADIVELNVCLLEAEFGGSAKKEPSPLLILYQLADR